jgi:F-box and leucine-rich repeat protein 15
MSSRLDQIAPTKFDDETPEYYDLELFEICWDDILIPKIICNLSLKDLFNFRCCSKLSKQLIDEYALPAWKDVNLSGNNSTHISQAFAVLADNCRNTVQLNVAKCNWITDNLLIPFLQNNQKLMVVNLNGNDSCDLTPSSLQPIIIRKNKLKVLKLAKCNWLTIGAMQALAFHLASQDLQELDISYCCSLNERCICILLHSFRKLRVLSLAYISNVTDNVMFIISKFTRNIQHLNLVGCHEVTDRGIG